MKLNQHQHTLNGLKSKIYSKRCRCFTLPMIVALYSFSEGKTFQTRAWHSAGNASISCVPGSRADAVTQKSSGWGNNHLDAKHLKRLLRSYLVPIFHPNPDRFRCQRPLLATLCIDCWSVSQQAPSVPIEEKLAWAAAAKARCYDQRR